MMRKIKVLFFTADPRLGRPKGEPLELAEDLRQITRRVRHARYGHHLVFESHGAARVDDLIDLLENTDARVVHFSGHGGDAGLSLVGRGGQRPHPLAAAALKRLFQTGHGSICLAVLSACSSKEEAQAIADVVGCAIGTLSDIGDDAAITFNSRFYEAIANGYSLHHAHEKACAALEAHCIPEGEYPRVFVRDRTVNPADLVFFKTIKFVPVRVAAATVVCAVTGALVFYEPPIPHEFTVSDIACSSEATVDGIRSLSASQGAASSTSADPAGAAAHVADAKAFYRARNYRAAASAFLQAAENGNGEAMGCLGYMYLYGRGMEPQPATGFEWVHRGAQQERDPHAQYALANAYLGGVGTSAREHLARDWFEKAAAQGYAEAMRSLGDLYRQEMNDSSYHHALLWYERAAVAGSVDAKVDLGLMHEFGWGIQRDAVVAMKWYRSAAAARSPRGMWAVGQGYQKGTGVDLDYKQAMTWYQRAAKVGSAEAMNSIGVLYENGFGVRKSYGKAVRWYKRAAQAGSPLAKGNLAALGRD